MHRTRSLIVGACAIALALTPALTTRALAAEPTTFVFTVDNFTWTDDLCGFPITHVENGTGKVTVFVDQQGNPVKSILHPATDYDPTASEIDFMKPGLERARRGAGVRS